MHPYDQEEGCHEVVTPAAHITHHPSGSRGRGSDGRDRDENSNGEKRGDSRCARGGDSPLATDKSHDQRDAGQMPGTEDDTEDTPNERGGQGDDGRSFDGMAERRKELFHITWDW